MSNLSGYIGTYTKEESKGIYYFEIDTLSENLINFKLAAEIDNPTYIISKNDYIFSTCTENNNGGVVSFKVNPDWSLTKLSNSMILGKGPCHIECNEDASLLFSANYHENKILSYRIINGRITETICEINHNFLDGETPHIHCVKLSDDESYLYALDLGLDKLYLYRNSNGKLSLVNTLSFTKGTGPRHLVIHKENIYVVTELSGEVIHIIKDNEKLIIKNSIKLSNNIKLMEGAAIRLDPNSEIIYVSERVENLIHIIGIKNNTLSYITSISSNGNGPRDFNISNKFEHLLCANQLSNNLSLYRIEKITKNIKSCGIFPCYSPVCVLFL